MNDWEKNQYGHALVEARHSVHGATGWLFEALGYQNDDAARQRIKVIHNELTEIWKRIDAEVKMIDAPKVVENVSAQPPTCADCGGVISSVGKYIGDGRWVC